MRNYIEQSQYFTTRASFILNPKEIEGVREFKKGSCFIPDDIHIKFICSYTVVAFNKNTIFCF